MQKKLYKSREDKMILGVCGGIAEYFKVDPTLVRVAMVFAGVAGVGIVGYVIAAFIMPFKSIG